MLRQVNDVNEPSLVLLIQRITVLSAPFKCYVQGRCVEEILFCIHQLWKDSTPLMKEATRLASLSETRKVQTKYRNELELADSNTFYSAIFVLLRLYLEIEVK